MNEQQEIKWGLQVRGDNTKENMDVEIKKSAWNLDIFWRLNRIM